MSPDVASLRDARSIRNFVTKATGSDRSITVLNRADMKGGLQLALIEKGLGAKPDTSIPDLGRRMVEALNLGIPASRRVPALRRHMAALVREVAGVSPAPGPASWLRRMVGS
jgi:pilus assembly protein CpaE